jgi:hypothetical protein
MLVLLLYRIDYAVNNRGDHSNGFGSQFQSRIFIAMTITIMGTICTHIIKT